VLLVGSDVKSLLSRFTSRYKSEYKDKTYRNVWVVCIRVLEEHEGGSDPGYGTVHPVLQAMDIRWHEYGCGLYSGMCLCVRGASRPLSPALCVPARRWELRHRRVLQLVHHVAAC